jgi:hypothetical protein
MIESLNSLLNYSNPEYERLESEWFEATTVEQQSEVLAEIQALFAEDPPAFTLYYPDTRYAYNSSAYDGWLAAEGHGIHHKWSLIPEASELMGVERVSQTTPVENASGGRAALYALVGVGVLALLALGVLLLRRRSARKTNEDQI